MPPKNKKPKKCVTLQTRMKQQTLRKLIRDLQPIDQIIIRDGGNIENTNIQNSKKNGDDSRTSVNDNLDGGELVKKVGSKGNPEKDGGELVDKVGSKESETGNAGQDEHNNESIKDAVVTSASGTLTVGIQSIFPQNFHSVMTHIDSSNHCDPLNTSLEKIILDPTDRIEQFNFLRQIVSRIQAIESHQSNNEIETAKRYQVSSKKTDYIPVKPYEKAEFEVSKWRLDKALRCTHFTEFVCKSFTMFCSVEDVFGRNLAGRSSTIDKSAQRKLPFSPTILNRINQTTYHHYTRQIDNKTEGDDKFNWKQEIRRRISQKLQNWNRHFKALRSSKNPDKSISEEEKIHFANYETFANNLDMFDSLEKEQYLISHASTLVKPKPTQNNKTNHHFEENRTVSEEIETDTDTDTDIETSDSDSDTDSSQLSESYIGRLLQKQATKMKKRKLNKYKKAKKNYKKVKH